jgi:signal transduction histidine kinase
MPEVGLAPQAVAGATQDGVRRQGWIGAALDRRFVVPLGSLLLAGLYYGSAQLGFALNFSGPVAAIVWLPVGVAIAFLYLAGLRFWPGVLLGDLLANSYSTMPLGSAIGQTSGNLLEVVLAVYLMRRLIGDGSPLGNVGNLARMLAAICAGTALSATIGLLSLRLGGVVSSADLPKLWRTWWLGDTSGALIVVPLAVAWWPLPSREWWRGHVAEAVILFVAILGLSELSLRTGRPLAYLVFPALIWAALRFGTRGATLAVAVAAGYAVWGTTHYMGPFVYGSITHSILATQLYLAVAALTCLSLAAAVSEREEFAGRLRASSVRLVEAADDERRRLEHNLHDGAQQRLTALAVRLGVSAEEMQGHPKAARVALESAQREVLVAIDELRDLAHGIHPSVLTRFGLARATTELAGRSAVSTQLLALPAIRFDDTAEATAYYVFAEAMTNAQKHSHATSIEVRGHLVPGGLRVEVADNGVGGAEESHGVGLQGLRDRVEAMGGVLIVASPRGAGTRVTATIPATAVGS